MGQQRYNPMTLIIKELKRLRFSLQPLPAVPAGLVLQDLQPLPAVPAGPVLLLLLLLLHDTEREKESKKCIVYKEQDKGGGVGEGEARGTGQEAQGYLGGSRGGEEVSFFLPPARAQSSELRGEAATAA